MPLGDTPKRIRSDSDPDTKMDMSVSDLAKLMQSQLDKNQQSTKDDIRRLGETISAQMDKLRTEIAADIDQLREENNKTFEELRTTIDKTTTDTTMAIDRVTRSNDLIVSGVPYVNGEDLSVYYLTWCRSLGYADNCIPHVDMRRLVKGTAIDGSVYMILMQFAITLQRNDFYGRYLKTRLLSLSQIGFAANKRIYINENIGPDVRNLRTKALALRKNGQLGSVFTKNGILYVKRNANDKDTAVTSEGDLELFVKRK